MRAQRRIDLACAESQQGQRRIHCRVCPHRPVHNVRIGLFLAEIDTGDKTHGTIEFGNQT